jgi:hypothetical protein
MNTDYGYNAVCSKQLIPKKAEAEQKKKNSQKD